MQEALVVLLESVRHAYAWCSADDEDDGGVLERDGRRRVRGRCVGLLWQDVSLRNGGLPVLLLVEPVLRVRVLSACKSFRHVGTRYRVYSALTTGSMAREVGSAEG